MSELYTPHTYNEAHRMKRRDSKIAMEASVTLRLPQELKDALEAAAAAERRSVSQVVALILESAMQKRGLLKPRRKK